MLGLGTSVTSIDSGQIYKELSELSNYADLDIHFDFSTLTGDHGDAVTAVPNNPTKGAASSYSIDAASGTPTLDRESLSRACVDFPNTADNDHFLEMAAAYSTTGKPMTFFIVFQWNAIQTATLVASAPDGYDDFIQLGTGGRGRIAFAGEASTIFNTSTTNGGSTAYSPTVDTPTVYLIRRDGDAVSQFWADNGLFVAQTGIMAGDTFTLGAIGGSTSGSNPDWNGKIFEVGLYDADIGDDNIPILLESLCTKWGINRR